MQSLHLSKYVSLKEHPKVVKWVTVGLRLLIGCVFIFSGFVKSVDPWGTIYKMTDYAAAMNISVAENLIVAGAFFLCAFEFILGVFFLCGCFRKGTAILGFAFMCVMLPLTLWIALFNPVADCGCFGDAITISNWATFWKNVLLTAGIIWLVKFNTCCKPLINESIQWIAVVATLGYIGMVEVAGYIYQPLIDFRKYKIGTPLISANGNEDIEPEYIFTYKKGEEVKDFPVDQLPDEEEGWEFVDRKEIHPAKVSANMEGDNSFHIWSGDEDVTYDVLGNEDSESSDSSKMLILLMPSLGDVSIAQTWRINSLYDWAQSHHIKMIAVVSGSESEIANWEDLSMPDYPIYMADDTEIKELARGNPAVIFVNQGIIVWKSALRAINIDDFMSPGTTEDPMHFTFDSFRGLRNLSLIYLAVMVLMIMSSFAFRLKSIFKFIKKPKK